ncbi:No apical meristem (NAM) protein [Corchorus capsularis]|uniref:No apical meristem (NAM) protein n=1 Tax=Corchorus capsularis TaxID=210143 RepID=A0A1R3GGC3_COCAP|nr:No apical meristem (NAM) protein [Corchorus capsularis]
MGKYSLPLGFRFHPTDVELVKYYLKRKILGKKFIFEAIAELDIYKHAPWDLPDMSLLKTGDLKWFFFCPIEKKYGKGARFNRATVYGYWKTTGKDRTVVYNEEVVGMIKTLIFHRGKASNGDRTDWVMHEYRLEEKELASKGVSQDTYVLCAVFKKDGVGPRNGAQYGAPFKEEEWSDDDDDENLFGTGSLSVFSKLAFGGASSSYAPESQCAEPSVLSSGLHTLPSPSVVNTDAATSLNPGIDSNAHHVPAVTSDAELALTFADAPQVPTITSDGTCMDAPQVPAVTSNANDVLTCVDVTQIPMVVDAMAVPALMEAPQIAHLPQVQESNDDIISMLDLFTEEDSEFFTYFSGEMTGAANNLSLESQVSEDNEIAWMLESFKEDDNQNNLWYP